MSALISLRRAEAITGLPYAYLRAAVIAGRLPAVDVAAPGTTKSAWRVDPDDLAAYVQTAKGAK